MTIPPLEPFESLGYGGMPQDIQETGERIESISNTYKPEQALTVQAGVQPHPEVGDDTDAETDEEQFLAQNLEAEPPSEWPPRTIVPRSALDISLELPLEPPTDTAAPEIEDAVQPVTESSAPPPREIHTPSVEAIPELTDRAITLLEEKNMSDLTPVAVGRRERDYYVDDPEDPTFFIKVRPAPTLKDYDKSWINTPEARRYTMNGIRRYGHLGELDIWADVANIINLPEVQEAATEQGYASISVIPPLAGGIDQYTRETILIYPWSDGKAAMDDDGNSLLSEEELSTVVDIANVAALTLEEQGIMPHDFSSANVIVETDSSGQKHIRITDLEAFFRSDLPPYLRLYGGY